MGGKRNRVEAVGYIRTSSATNVGRDKDSEKRQRRAIEAYAKREHIAIVDWFADPAVSGADPIETRPGFSALLDRVEGNGVKLVLVEDASRFARDLMTQELGILSLIKRGMRVVASNGDDLTETDDPMKKAMRQMAGVFAELEKNRLVAKLRGARERKKAETGKCGGRKSVQEAYPEAVALALQLRADSPRISYRSISAALREAGHITRRGTEHSPTAIRHMLEG